MNERFHWLDVDRIGEHLADVYPDADPYNIGFPELADLVRALPGFEEEPGHRVNERILEAIQAAWLDELDPSGLADEDAD